MRTETTTNTSPFESGDWGRWTNFERFTWLRAFYEGLKSKEEQITKEFKLDKKKMKRLADAVAVFEAKVKVELAILDKAVAYDEAMVELCMEAVLKSGSKTPISFPAFGTAKRVDHKGN